ncbi:MAG: hypothetical protein ACHQU1_06120 [Gemmatimonadales bacterium]
MSGFPRLKPRLGSTAEAAWALVSLQRQSRAATLVAGAALALAVLPASMPAQTAAISINQNPVVVAPVVLHWPTPGGVTRVDVFTVTGAPVTSETFASDAGRWPWDLTNQNGAPVVNGAYYIVVTLSDNTRLRRRLLVAR